MKVIGLTGGIGSGKTTVSEYLKKKGFPVIDADKVAREIVGPGMDATKMIESEFGSAVINSDGSLNRKKLASLVFSDAEQLTRLNTIMHKQINAIIRKRILVCEKEKEKVAFIDAPLLFETGLDTLTQETWVIDTPEELRIERVRSRDAISVEEIKARISSQMDQKTKNAKATLVIDNSTGLEELLNTIDQLIIKYEK